MKKIKVIIDESTRKSSKQKLFERMVRIGEMPINENNINEIDWEGDFSDVSKKCINPEELKNDLNHILGGGKQDNTGKPIMHNKRIPTDDAGEIDVQAFIDNITTRPSDILSVNSKMAKSKDEDSFTVNIGIPALRGLVYDEDNKEFYYVNTCPGAGSCAVICYARKGSYIQYPDVFVKQTRVLNYLLNDPQGFKNQLKDEISKQARRFPNKKIVFRWNDAGDFFTEKYYKIASEITQELQQEGVNIESYAYTKMGDIFNLEDKYVTKNWSDDANKRESGKVDASKAKKGVIVPKELFFDLMKPKEKGRGFERDEKGRPMYNGEEEINILKDRLSKKFNVPKESILTYDEMMNTPKGEKSQYNVIVRPKDGDVSAQRDDVENTFLLFH